MNHKKSIKFPTIDKRNCVQIYVGGEKNRELREHIINLPNKYKRGELGNISSGSDYLRDMMISGIETEKKAKAPREEALAHNERSEPVVQAQADITHTQINVLPANYNLPRIDEYYEKKIDGKTIPQVFDFGLIPIKTTANIYMGAQELILEISHNTKIMTILNKLKSVNDTRNKIKMGRTHGQVVTELSGYRTYETVKKSPPTPQMITVDGKEIEYNPDEWEDLPEQETLTTKPIFF